LLDGGNPDDFSSGPDEFLYKYVDNVEANFDGTAAAIFDAYKAGRTAIVNKDYDERNAQTDILREKIAVLGYLDTIYNTPTNGFWNVTEENLNEVADAIAAKFSFTAAEVD